MKHFIKAGCFFLILCSGLVSCENNEAPVTDLWEQLRNSAWVKDGDEYPSLGFFAPNRGPFDERYSSSDQNTSRNPYGMILGGFNSNVLSLEINRTGRQITLGWWGTDEHGKPVFNSSFVFNISVSADGNSLTLSSSGGGSGGGSVNVDGSESNPYGRYTRMPSAQGYNFGGGQERLWEQIQNTAWTKQGNSAISLGFYEEDAGPLFHGKDDYGDYSQYTPLTRQLREEFNIWDYYGDAGYAAYQVPLEGASKGHSFSNLSVSLAGKRIRSRFIIRRREGNATYDHYIEVYSNIAVSGNTLTISDSQSGWYDEQYVLPFEAGIDDHSVGLEQFLDYLDGTYTLASSASDYNFGFDPEVGKKAVLSQILNTAWTKSGNSEPTVGFYEAGKGPISPDNGGYSDHDYFIFMVSVDGTRLSSSKNLFLDRKGRKIRSADYLYAGSLDITVSNDGNILTITNAHEFDWPQWWINSSYTTNEQTGAQINGTYTKASSDPNFSWNR